MASSCTSLFTRGDHVCLFYRTPEDLLSTVVPFVKEGLERNERCFCVLPLEQTTGIATGLEAAGMAVAEERRRGALHMLRPEEVYLANGCFDREEMAARLERSIKEAVAEGYEGFRAVGDLGWAAHSSDACTKLPEYEALMAEFYPLRPALGLCTYSMQLFTRAELNRMLKMHSYALLPVDDVRRAMRMREGDLYGEVIFDRTNPTIFHYTVQDDDSPQYIHSGQESSLSAAMGCVKANLRKQH